MAYFIGAFIVLIVISLAVILVQTSRSTTAAPKAEERKWLGPRAVVSAFHVRGDTAITVFEAPLGSDVPSQHLIDLLSFEAVEFLQAKQREGLPLEDVTKIDVQAMRGDEPESIAIIELPDAGQLPSTASMRTVAEPAIDPIGEMAKVVADTSVVSKPATSGELPPLGSFIQLGGPAEASLRAIGVNTADITLHDLVSGLFQVSGYLIEPGQATAVRVMGPDVEELRLLRAGQSTTSVILPHKAGSYPEIDERVLTELSILAGQVQGDSVLFISDKYGPYSMYEHERRDKRLILVTRERLQAFVDSFGFG